MIKKIIFFPVVLIVVLIALVCVCFGEDTGMTAAMEKDLRD